MRKAILTITILLPLLLLTTPAAHAKPNECIICYHVVQPGETIYCIARAYGVSPWAIASENGLMNPNKIYPGQTLAIPDAYAWVPPGPVCTKQCPPPGPVGCTCMAYHTVVAGENLYRISLHYGVSMWQIAECNSILNLNYVRAGDVLCIPVDP